MALGGQPCPWSPSPTADPGLTHLPQGITCLPFVAAAPVSPWSARTRWWAPFLGRNTGSGWWLTSVPTALRQLVPAGRVAPEQPVLMQPV